MNHTTPDRKRTEMSDTAVLMILAILLAPVLALWIGVAVNTFVWMIR
jgi:nitrate reductase NapE component